MDKKLKKGIITVFFANMINVIFSLSTNFFLPKYLSLESYAGIKEYQLYLSCIGLFHCGFLDAVYLRYGGQNLQKNLDETFSTELSTLAVFQTIVTFVLTGFGLQSHNIILLCFGLSLLPQNMIEYFKILYQATGEFRRYGRTMNLSTAALFTVNMLLLCIVKSDNMYLYISSYVILYFAIWFILEFNFRRRHLFAKSKWFSIKILMRNINTGFLLTLGNLSSVFLTSMDRWFIKGLMDTNAFAQYSFAVSIENFLNLAVTPVSITLYNYFCREDDGAADRNLFIYIVMFATVLPSAAFGVKFIIKIFLRKYEDAVYIIFFLFGAQMFYIIIKSVYINLYKVHREQQLYFMKLVFILGAGVLFNLLCYGIMHRMEAFSAGTLLCAIAWYLISGTDFRYLKIPVRIQLYLFSELAVFLITGMLLPPVSGLIVYMAVTLILMRVFLREALARLTETGVQTVKRLRNEGR